MIDSKYVSLENINSLLISRFNLVTDPWERGDGKTYFWGNIVWHPTKTTRVLRIILRSGNLPPRIKRLISSDANNSVFMREPLSLESISYEAASEIELFFLSRATAAT
ncbi:hypothetical protein R77591_00040 [Ralstonia mannitolilytica]|uniref:Uncharacterized protein n=1 Tax=Ralstonia mannitolilytica TaxID=105219 RepID=A0AAD2EEW0_9RALS|nr:hypothetical protein R77591_00040 [Ralstonia mannitolilytica]CAJ0867597.1 hypothetical protein R77569_01990 [Ralstonia mannitolilytica]